MSLQNAYSSKIIKGFSTSEILLSVEKANLTDKSHVALDNILYVTEVQDVPPFPYPIYDVDNRQVLVDSRPYTSLDRSGDIKIRNGLDEQLNLLCARLENSWVLCDRPETAQRAFSMSSEVLTRWLTNTISHRYGLPPNQKIRLMALVAMFSIGQYYNNIEDKLTIARHLQSIARNNPITIEVIEEVSERIDGSFPRDVDEFIIAIGKVDFGPRLKDFNTKALYTVLSGSWWSNTNAATFVAIAVEYPPAMAALVEMAIENSMFKRTQIGTIVYDMNRGNNFTNYSRGLLMFMEQYK